MRKFEVRNTTLRQRHKRGVSAAITMSAELDAIIIQAINRKLKNLESRVALLSELHWKDIDFINIYEREMENFRTGRLKI